jgi:hypothetical protein
MKPLPKTRASLPAGGTPLLPTPADREREIRRAEDNCEKCGDFVAWSNERQRQLELIPLEGGGFFVACPLCAVVIRSKRQPKRKAGR